MRYKNPVILQDFSNPDVIRRNGYFYMISSSYNFLPGIPILESRNLVNWRIINFVYYELPFKKYQDVCHGEGSWASALRYHDGVYYTVISFPNEGIYVASTSDIKKGNWTKLWCLIKQPGIIDPCPIWVNDKCYLVCAFNKESINFDSCIALFEVASDLKSLISSTYKIIFDGHDTQPRISGPKIYYRNNNFYIMASAGSLKTGWQTCLRSENIYGPYQEKIVLSQNDTSINGPHQGALVEINKKEWAFIHIQEMGVYGQVIDLEPVSWINDWPICGTIEDELLNGSPVYEHEFFIDKKSTYKLPLSDDFTECQLKLMWQTPANKDINWYSLNGYLKLNCVYHNEKALKALNKTPNLFLTRIEAYSFCIKTLCVLDLQNDGDETGLCYMGKKYQYICVKRINERNHLQIKQGYFNQDNDIVLFDSIYNSQSIEFMLKFKEPNIYQLGFNGTYLKDKYLATPGIFVGGKCGIYAKGLILGGSANYQYYKIKKVK